MRNFKNCWSAFLFFLVSHIVNMSFEKMEIPQGGQKKEHDEGRSEPSRRKRHGTKRVRKNG